MDTVTTVPSGAFWAPWIHWKMHQNTLDGAKNKTCRTLHGAGETQLRVSVKTQYSSSHCIPERKCGIPLSEPILSLSQGFLSLTQVDEDRVSLSFQPTLLYVPYPSWSLYGSNFTFVPIYSYTWPLNQVRVRGMDPPPKSQSSAKLHY